MHLIHGTARRQSVDLAIAMAIAFGVFLLNLSITFGGRVLRRFEPLAEMPITHWIINLLFVWLCGLLWLAFIRWRQAARRSLHLEAIISGISPDALVAIDPNRRILMCNDSVERIFGYKPREVLSQDTSLLYYDRRTAGSPHEIHDCLERDGFHIGTATGRRKDGRTVPLEIITGQLTGRDGAVLLMRDITERLWVEEERRRMEARARQWEKIESLGLLAGGIAHDFNNILTIISGHTDILRMHCKAADADSAAPARFTENVKASTDEIRLAADRAAEMCDRLLSFSGKARVNPKPLDLSRLCAETGQMLEAAVSDRARVRYNLGPNLPAVVVDAVQTRQVIMNLIKNAVEALPAEGGEVTVSTGTQDCTEGELQDAILPGPAPAGRYVYLQVSDTGCGMDEKTRRQIFEPFFTTKDKGHGLGLASVMGVVRAHRGALKLATAPGKGSTFTVLLPTAAN